MARLVRVVCLLIVAIVLSCSACTPKFEFSLTQLPNKIEYVQGQPLQLDGAVVTAMVKGEETVLSLPCDEVTASGYNPDVLGAQNVSLEVNFQGYSASLYFAVTVKVDTSVTTPTAEDKSLQITAMPIKNEYIEGETPDFSGLELEMLKTDGSAYAVTAYTVSPSTDTALAVGDNEFVFSYAGKSCAINLTATAKSPTAISCISQPTRKNYVVGDDFVGDGFVVRVTYNNGTTAEVDKDSFTFAPSTFTSRLQTSVVATLDSNTALSLTIDAISVVRAERTVDVTERVVSAYAARTDVVITEVGLATPSVSAEGINIDSVGYCTFGRSLTGFYISVGSFLKYSTLALTTDAEVLTLNFNPTIQSITSPLTDGSGNEVEKLNGLYHFQKSGIEIYDYISVPCGSAQYALMLCGGTVAEQSLSDEGNAIIRIDAAVGTTINCRVLTDSGDYYVCAIVVD